LIGDGLDNGSVNFIGIEFVLRSLCLFA